MESCGRLLIGLLEVKVNLRESRLFNPPSRNLKQELQSKLNLPCRQRRSQLAWV
jgi:hypothetical protein